MIFEFAQLVVLIFLIAKAGEVKSNGEDDDADNRFIQLAHDEPAVKEIFVPFLDLRRNIPEVNFIT